MSGDDILARIDEVVEEYVEWDGWSPDAATWSADGSHQPDEISGGYYGEDDPPWRGGDWIDFGPSLSLEQAQRAVEDRVTLRATRRWGIVTSSRRWGRQSMLRTLEELVGNPLAGPPIPPVPSTPPVVPYPSGRRR